MKSNSLIIIFCLALSMLFFSCKKDENIVNGQANMDTAASAVLPLNNRVLAGFIIDASTLPNLPTGLLPESYNNFRKLLTYDTIVPANKPIAYKAGDVITIVGYIKGDDFAIGKRKINFSIFKAPAFFITPANPPTVLNVMQYAEDRYRSYLPAAATVDSTFSLASIASTSVAPFNIVTAYNETVSGINYNTYLVQLKFTIPAATATKWLPGQVFSINFNAGVAAGDLGNVNWIYAFKIK